MMTSSSSIRKHAGSGPASEQPAVPEPSHAERARTLMYLGRIGSVSTLSRKQPGFPFGSVMPYGLDDHGRPIFLISTMAMHTQNLQADPRASLLVTQNDTGGDPLGASRVTLVGNVLPMPESEVLEARKLYLARYANSKYWVDFEDFSFYRMDVMDVYYVGGFGVMGWVSASEYDRSQPDPLAASMAEIIRHMNADHKDALVLLAIRGAKEIADIVLAHHECPDGSGYPRGCKGEEIPVEARIVRVADVFSSLVEERPYKAALEVTRAMKMIKELAGTKLDVVGVRVLQQLVDEGAPVL